MIPVYEAGESDGRLFIAMRWVEGTDLRSLIASEERLDPARIVPIVEQLGEALDAAHAGGLVHRDVKPANVMLTETRGREHAFLTDFGLTKRTASTTALTQAGHFVGTPDYMPPGADHGRAGRRPRRTCTHSGACSSTRSPAGRRTTGTARWRRCTRTSMTRRPAPRRPRPARRWPSMR